jgi:NAD(P)-dependent dehydrogenase (short-subunit alcohol dehydrogenase family)
MTGLTDQVILITGAGRGSGRRLAEALGGRGAIVAANDISPVNVDETVAHIRSQGGRAAAYIHDVAKKVAVQTLINEVQDEWGGIDVLIQHAAVEPRAALLEMDEWDWHRVLDVNLTGAFLMLQSAGRVMRARGRGLIVHLVPESDPGAERGAYRASMEGLRALGRQAAEEFAPYGVRVHTLASGQTGLAEAVIALCEG